MLVRWLRQVCSWSEKLVRYEVDFGEEIGKGDVFWYSSGMDWELIGKSMFVVNMKYKMGPRKVGDDDNGGARR